jgi:two-component system chemotaxis response regulator CheY
MKFLVVDDSATMRRIMINALQRIGYTDAVEASDGQEALDRFGADIGFIITDWNMPVMSGLEFARSVRATPCGQTVPILLVTTRGAREDIVSAVEAGVNNYILKPFTPSVLKEKIDRLLAVGAAA